jgi:hypothetical protein
LNIYGDVGAGAIIHYLEKHNFSYLKDRVRYEYSADFGVGRPLREIWIKILDIDSLEFVEFYEDVYRFRKFPRYENLLITVLVSIASGLAANDLYERFKKWKKKDKVNNDLYDKFSGSSLILLEYLIKVYAVREAFMQGKISYKRFEIIRDFLKGKIFFNLENQEIESEFNILWDKFAKKHVSFDKSNLIFELGHIIRLDLSRPSYSEQNQKKEFFILRTVFSCMGFP